MLAQYETQLKYRKVDENGDMVFGCTGESGFLESGEAMAQVLKTRLGACEDEWWEDDPGALPWFTGILGSMVSQGRVDEIDLMVIERITSTVGVNSVSNIESYVKDRHYYFTCTAHTVHGDVPVEVSV
jgi:hypothetical protein